MHSRRGTRGDVYPTAAATAAAASVNAEERTTSVKPASSMVTTPAGEQSESEGRPRLHIHYNGRRRPNSMLMFIYKRSNRSNAAAAAAAWREDFVAGQRSTYGTECSPARRWRRRRSRDLQIARMRRIWSITPHNCPSVGANEQCQDRDGGEGARGGIPTGSGLAAAAMAWTGPGPGGFS